MAGERQGSSPLARGTRVRRTREFGVCGLIPARAGNTRLILPRRAPPRAHPRSRGEHPFVPHGVGGVGGSSPLARGTPDAALAKALGVGLIPARAGNTEPLPAPPLRRRAHPRSRGEHHRPTGSHHRVGGSSPLARGTLKVLDNSTRRRGLIPARAGNTTAGRW